MVRQLPHDDPSRPPPEHGRLADYVPAVTMAVGTLAATLYMTMFVLPTDAQVAVIFPPWSERQDTWSAVFDAGGLIVDEHFGGPCCWYSPIRRGLPTA